MGKVESLLCRCIREGIQLNVHLEFPGMLQPLSSRGSKQNVPIISFVTNFIDRTFLSEEICIVVVCLSTFRSASASAKSSLIV